jgi:hypothetical protein
MLKKFGNHVYYWGTKIPLAGVLSPMKRLKLRRPPDRWELAGNRREQVVELREQGYNQPEIADILGITQARVSQIMAPYDKQRTNKRHMLRLLDAEPVCASA